MKKCCSALYCFLMNCARSSWPLSGPTHTQRMGIAYHQVLAGRVQDSADHLSRSIYWWLVANLGIYINIYISICIYYLSYSPSFLTHPLVRKACTRNLNGVIPKASLQCVASYLGMLDSPVQSKIISSWFRVSVLLLHTRNASLLVSTNK